ncbi:RNA polymerase sigma factor [Wenyingzhuangia sp. IMCC45574]
MPSETENSKKLQDFFGKEYQNLRAFVSSKIRDTASRDAEDIIQDVALNLFAGADRYAPINNVAGFVYRSLRNKIIDIMRGSSTSEVTMEDGWSKLSEELMDADENPFAEEKITVLKKCLAELKPVYRDIIKAVDFEGYSYQEISKQTGISQGTLMSRRHRAIGILYKHIEIELKNVK